MKILRSFLILLFLIISAGTFLTGCLPQSGEKQESQNQEQDDDKNQNDSDDKERDND